MSPPHCFLAFHVGFPWFMGGFHSQGTGLMLGCGRNSMAPCGCGCWWDVDGSLLMVCNPRGRVGLGSIRWDEAGSRTRSPWPSPGARCSPWRGYRRRPGCGSPRGPQGAEGSAGSARRWKELDGRESPPHLPGPSNSPREFTHQTFWGNNALCMGIVKVWVRRSVVAFLSFLGGEDPS